MQILRRMEMSENTFTDIEETDVVTPEVLSDFEPAAVTMSADLADRSVLALTWADELVVENQGDLDEATGTISQMKKRTKAIEDARKFLVNPLNAHVKKINDIFRSPKANFDKAEAIAKGKCTAFVVAEQKRQREEQDRLDREAEKQRKFQQTLARKALENEDQEKAAQHMEKSHAVETPVAAPQAETSEGTHVTKTWVGEITNLRAFIGGISAGIIPFDPDMISISQSKLNEKARALKDQVKWPGVKFEEKVSMAIK